MTKTSVKLIFLSQLNISMVNRKIKSCNEKQISIYLGSKNGNLGSTDSGRNPDNVSLIEWKQEVFMRKRKGAITQLKKRKKSFLWVLTSKATAVSKGLTSGSIFRRSTTMPYDHDIHSPSDLCLKQLTFCPVQKFWSVQMKIVKGISLQRPLQLYIKMASVMSFFHTIKRKHNIFKWHTHTVQD